MTGKRVQMTLRKRICVHVLLGLGIESPTRRFARINWIRAWKIFADRLGI